METLQRRPETSADWTHKYHKTALLFITRFFVLNIPLFTFSCRNFLTLFVSFDILWQLATTHPRDKTRDGDTNSSRQNDVNLRWLFTGETSQALALPYLAAENIKNLLLALRTREKLWARLVGKSRPQCEMSSFIHFQLTKCRVETCFLLSVASDARIVMNRNLKKLGV